MHVILLERVENLGTIGDEVKVRDGYARNFLLPNKKALRANDANRKVFEARRAELEARNAESKATAEKASSKIDGTSYILIRSAGEGGQLYGSVSSRDIADEIVKAGAKIDRNSVVLDKPIKSIGVYDVRVRLHADVSATVKVNVARSADEAERQAKGENVIASAVEADRADEAAQAKELAANAFVDTSPRD
ncbi:50S ribosomal protein L9 [Candidatus Viadribacter manganicus]|uniref:Large ribosomal subunit protein bL9 n=1 Tax=Candidatus Viadribacter manganicus TaxID=1759059 RepID=A0A1B1AE02_9PROT|nr:50S ribosomal protein L9 [Candidatus Viadribacter manganicus]ANP44790.1 50S ribosomal protein L9 [Candidatus Viadribacter manganicus]